MEEIFDLKNITGKKTKILDVVSGDAASGCLKKFNDNLRLCLPLQLSYGDLNEVKDFSRLSLKKLYDSVEYLPFENGYNFNREIEFLKDNIDDVDLIRVWSSHLNPDEYCLLLYICSIIKNKKISVVFSEEFDYSCLSVGMINSNEIHELIKREHILSENEINCYARKWEKLVKENTELRYIVNGKLVSVSIDYFDEIIINELRKLGETPLYSFIGYLIGKQIINDSGDLLYKYIIRRLINNGKIIKNCDNGKDYIKINE